MLISLPCTMCGTLLVAVVVLRRCSNTARLVVWFISDFVWLYKLTSFFFRIHNNSVAWLIIKLSVARLFISMLIILPLMNMTSIVGHVNLTLDN